MTEIGALRSKKRSRKSRQGGRAGRALSYVAVCLVCGWLGVRMAYPFVLAEHWRIPNDEIEKQVRRLRIQNQRAEKEAKQADTNAGILGEARGMGWVAKNEVRLRIPGR